LKFKLPKIYPITDTRLSGLSHAEQVRRLINGGADLIQLREKHRLAGEFYADAREAIAIARAAGARVIINDRVDIALALEADGVHLGQDDLPPEQARKILGPGAIIGFSTHSVEQATAALKLPINYIAIGPVFGTSTKQNPDPVVGLEGVRLVREAFRDTPLVAIGGITAGNIRSVLDAGADSAAVISEVVADPDRIAERVSRLMAA
jgi:thiamine-phosphate pyrophosphorylase